MELTRKELDDIVAYHTTCGDKKGYTIFLDGHQFVSSNELGVDPREIYKHDDFVHAWDNFVR